MIVLHFSLVFYILFLSFSFLPTLSLSLYIYIYIYIYIVIQRQTVSLYHSLYVWLDMQDDSSWDRNPPNFTLEMVSNYSAISATYTRIIRHIY